MRPFGPPPLRPSRAARPSPTVRPLLAAALLAVLPAVVGCSGPGTSDGGGGSEATAPAPSPAHETGSPATAPTAYRRYVALGDSYTAAPLVPPTDTSTICLRSGVNYPALVARSMPGTRLTDVSCSGATTGDVLHRQVGDFGSVPPQIDAVTRRTDLVTIGLGGNDDGLFEAVLGRCTQLATSDPTGTPCRAAFAQDAPQRLRQTFADIRRNVAGVVSDVRRRAPDARVLVVGYPQIVPASGRCRDLPLAAGDYAFGRTVNRGLTRAVQQGARAAHASYVDLWSSTAGHDICAPDPWINGRVTAVGRALAYHPLAAEQRHVADLVLAALGRPSG